MDRAADRAARASQAAHKRREHHALDMAEVEVQDDNSTLVKVTSCFGGLAIYK